MRDNGTWGADWPVHQDLKLCDIEDTSLLDDITTVRNAMKKNVIDERKVNLKTSRRRNKQC